MVLTVASVLRSGPEYRPEHVFALARSVSRNLSLPHRFVCLTDLVSEVEAGDVEAIRLPEPWPGWWSKICLFREGLLQPPILFVDLDTLIVSAIDDIVLGHKFTVLASRWGLPSPSKDMCSALMAWDCNLSPLYRRFKQTPEQLMVAYRSEFRWSDQNYIWDHSKVRPAFFQDKFPGRIVHYRYECRDGQVPAGTSIIRFGGRPRPWQTELGKQILAEQASA